MQRQRLRERAYATVYDGSPYKPNNPTSNEEKEYGRRRTFFATIEKLPDFKVKFGRQLPNYDDFGKIIGYKAKRSGRINNSGFDLHSAGSEKGC